MRNTDEDKVKFVNEVLSMQPNLDKYCNDQDIIAMLKKDYKNFSNKQIMKIIDRILNQAYTNIKMVDLSGPDGSTKKLEVTCSKYFEERGEDKQLYFKINYLHEMKEKIYEHIYNTEKDIDDVQDDTSTEKSIYYIPDSMKYDKFREEVCKAPIFAQFKYNFVCEDGKCKGAVILNENNTIQVIELDITTLGQRFNYPLKNVYYCPECHARNTQLECETKSVDGKFRCPTEIEDETPSGRPRTRVCGTLLKPDEELSISRTAYYYQVQYQDTDGKSITGDAYSFSKLNIGRVTAAIFRINLHYKDMKFMIVDVKEHQLNKFELPRQDPNENYIFTLQKKIDKFIKDRTGLGIWGLIPIKAALILQAANGFFGFRRDMHLQIVGEKSSGKSMILKNYGYVLHGNLFITAAGNSTSVPSMRGTMRTIKIMKEIKIPTIGYLGQYRGIHIDEMKDNPQLLEDMKGLLSEATYSNNKSDSDSGVKERIAQISVSENLNTNDMGMYIGGVRKRYMIMENAKIENKEYEKWDDNWDLYQPLDTYPNIYLQNAIKHKREEMRSRGVFWIDNYSLPLHDRFPFYFYLVNGKKGNEELSITALESDELVGLEQAQALKTDDIAEYFKSCIPYVKRDDKKYIPQIKKVISELNLDNTDLRREKMYRDIVRVSRIVNKRDEITEMDLDMLRFVLTNTDRCLCVDNTNTYSVMNKPIVISKEEKEKIQKQMDTLDNYHKDFGLSGEDPFGNL